MENMVVVENQSLSREFEEKGAQKIYVSDHVNELQYTSTKPESYIVDIERFSHTIEKDINANSRSTLQRNLSRKGSLRKTNLASFNEKDNNLIATSPRAASLLGPNTLEKSMAVTMGTTCDHTIPQVHNQITVVAGIGMGNGGATATGNKVGTGRFCFRRSSSSSSLRNIDPRRILFFFATMSSIGTILLIYFTLSMAKFNGEDNSSN